MILLILKITKNNKSLIKNDKLGEIVEFERRLEEANMHLKEEEKLKPNISSEWILNLK